MFGCRYGCAKSACDGGVAEGRKRRDEGAARVAANEQAHSEWTAEAWNALLGLAKSGVEFNGDEVRERAGDPVRPNAMGSLFLHAVKAKLIERVGERQMARPGAHARRTAVYRGRTH